MCENNHESSEEFPQFIDIRQLESQLQSEKFSSEDKADEDSASNQCQSWVNWYFFIIQGCLHELQNKAKKEDFDSSEFDRFVPQTKLGRQIGVMHYVLHEGGKIYIEEMLFIDVVLRRIRSFSPNMIGIDRYDEMGVLQLHHGLRHFVEDFFSLSPKKRLSVLADFENAGHFAPEIIQLINRLKNLASIPKAKPDVSLSQDNATRIWPNKLTGRDLELFKLLSGIESTSPRNQALSVLNFILPEEPASTSSHEDLSEPIRFEPGDKERIERLLKRFPALKNRYPYLLKIIENDIPAEKYNANSDNFGHLYNSVLPSTLLFPTVLLDAPKESANQNGFSNRFVKWGMIIAVLCSLLKLAGILFNAWVK